MDPFDPTSTIPSSPPRCAGTPNGSRDRSTPMTALADVTQRGQAQRRWRVTAGSAPLRRR